MNRPHLEELGRIQKSAQATHMRSVKSVDVTVVEIREQERTDRNSSLCYVGTRESRYQGSNEKTPGGLYPRPTMRSYKWPLVVASIMLAMFLFALDNTIAADIAPVIAQDFDAIAKLPWVAVSFCLGAVCTGLLWGRLYTIFDNKYLFIAAVVLFEAGSAVCGSAPNMDALIIGRLICGVGGAGVYGGSIVLISSFTRVPERPLYLSLFGLVWGLGAVLGPIIGGCFAVSSLTWRWSFYINLPLGLGCAPVYLFMIPSHVPKSFNAEDRSLSLPNKLLRLDLVGATLQILGWTCFVISVTYGGVLWAWKSAQVIALLTAAAVLFAAFAVQQYFSLLVPTPADRLFPCAFAANWELCILFAQTAASIAASFISIYLIPVFFQFVRGATALKAATSLLPFVILMVAGVIINGLVMGKTGRYTPFFLCGSLLVLVGGALMYTVSVETSNALFYAYSGLIALGSGLYGQASFPVVQAKVNECECPDAAVEDEDEATDIISRAVAFIGAAQMWGITISLTIANNVFLNSLKAALDDILPGSSKLLLDGGVGTAKLLKVLTPDLKVRVLEAIVSSVGKGYILVMASGAFSVVLSLCMRWKKLFLQPGVM